MIDGTGHESSKQRCEDWCLDYIKLYCIMILMALHKAYQEMLGWKLSVVSGRMEENSYYKGVCADH